MQPLPIDERLGEIVSAVRSGRDLVLQAPPGTGKTTRVPPALLDAELPGGGGVVVLEPRRMAARLSARRVAGERGVRLGGEVGYRVRFESAASEETRLLFVTEGVLVRRLLRDSELEGISVVVLDEFHERSLQADLALMLVREVQSALRPDLRIVIMSATLDALGLGERLQAHVIQTESPLFPVELEHLDRRDDLPIAVAARQAVLRELDRSGGRLDQGMLVFLPGVGEIRRALSDLRPVAASRGFDLFALHGDLSLQQQEQAVGRGRRPRVVLSTNVAETSVTLEGIRTVIDSGWARVLRNDPATGVDRLRLERITRASAEQRAGRAGRLGPGRCIRLFSKGELREMAATLQPEVLRVDLCEALLLLKQWGSADPRRLAWITPPGEAAMDVALDLLVALGACASPTGPVTELGRRLARLPVHPRLGRLLLAAKDRGCAAAGAELAAICQVRPRQTEGSGLTARSDLLALRDLYHELRRVRFDRAFCQRLGLRAREFQAVEREAVALQRLLGAGREPPADERELLKCVLAGFPDRVARRLGAGRRDGLMTGGLAIELDRNSVVREPELFVALDVTRLGAGRRGHVRLASGIEPDWLAEIHPALARREDETIWNEERQAAEGRRRWLHQDLCWKEAPLDRPDPERAAELLARAGSHPRFLNELLRGGRLEQTLLRIECLRELRPDLGLERADEALLKDALRAACPGRSSLRELQQAPLSENLIASLDRSSADLLARWCPSHVRLPSGRQAPIVYRRGQSPLVSAKLQEFFGTRESPRIAAGKLVVAVDLLAPNGRSVQITTDLGSFWSNLYPRERRELGRRYPRHPWPEDPISAKPSARPLPRRGRRG